MDAVTPRGPNLKLRKKMKMDPSFNDEEFNKIMAEKTYPGAKEKKVLDQEDLEEGMEAGESEDDEDEQFARRTIQVGDQNFTFSFA